MRAIWPKGYQRGSLGKSHQNGDYLKTSNAKKLSSRRNRTCSLWIILKALASKRKTSQLNLITLLHYLQLLKFNVVTVSDADFYIVQYVGVALRELITVTNKMTQLTSLKPNTTYLVEVGAFDDGNQITEASTSFHTSEKQNCFLLELSFSIFKIAYQLVGRAVTCSSLEQEV